MMTKINYKLEKYIYGWTMKIGNESYYDVPEDFALIIKQLEEENKKLKFATQDTYDSANDTCRELQQRINKALGYIYRMTRVIDYDDDEFITWKHIEDIDKILRGENDE